MRDFSDDDNLFEITAAVNTRSSHTSSLCQGRRYGPPKPAVRALHHSKNHLYTPPFSAAARQDAGPLQPLLAFGLIDVYGTFVNDDDIYYLLVHEGSDVHLHALT
jgi:hypothetical protein